MNWSQLQLRDSFTWLTLRLVRGTCIFTNPEFGSMPEFLVDQCSVEALR